MALTTGRTDQWKLLVPLTGYLDQVTWSMLLKKKTPDQLDHLLLPTKKESDFMRIIYKYAIVPKDLTIYGIEPNPGPTCKSCLVYYSEILHEYCIYCTPEEYFGDVKNRDLFLEYEEFNVRCRMCAGLFRNPIEYKHNKYYDRHTFMILVMTSALCMRCDQYFKFEKAYRNEMVYAAINQLRSGECLTNTRPVDFRTTAVSRAMSRYLSTKQLDQVMREPPSFFYFINWVIYYPNVIYLGLNKMVFAVTDYNIYRQDQQIVDQFMRYDGSFPYGPDINKQLGFVLLERTFMVQELYKDMELKYKNLYVYVESQLLKNDFI